MSGPTATYYDILKVSRRARPDSVRMAYRRLAQKVHPDKLPGNADAQRVMAALNEAYAVLSDPGRRASYDRSLEVAPSRAKLSFQRRLAEVQQGDRAWPWWLLFATLAFSAAAVGVSVYKGYVPGAGTAVPVTHAHMHSSAAKLSNR